MGTKFTGILAQLNTPTGDGRQINALHWDDPPWPLKFDIQETGHTAPIVGDIHRVWFDGDLLRGEGELHDDSTDPDTVRYANRVIELLSNTEGPSVGVSVELDEQVVELRVSKEKWDQWNQLDEDAHITDMPEPETDENGRVTIDTTRFDDFLEVTTDARLRAAAIVDTPAFADATLALAASLTLVASNTVSAFHNPQFGPTGDDDPRLVWQQATRPDETSGWGCPLTVNDDGTIYGHVALKTRCHGAYAQCVAPPHEQDFTHYLTGEAEHGTPTGPLIMNTTHGVGKHHNHLADTGLAVADVTVGNDTHGIWVAGKLRPNITPDQLATLKGSALSGEWHPIGGRLRLVGILAVNSPGFLIQRRALAASGALFTDGPGCCDPVDSMDDRLAALERAVVQLLRTP